MAIESGQKNLILEPILINSEVFDLTKQGLIFGNLAEFLHHYSIDTISQSHSGVNRQTPQLANEVEINLGIAGQDIARSALAAGKVKIGSTVIGVPESGWSCALGVQSVVKGDVIFPNIGRNANSNAPIFSAEQLSIMTPEIVIADDFLFQGKALKKIISQLSNFKLVAITAVGNKFSARNLKIPIIMGSEVLENGRLSNVY